MAPLTEPWASTAVALTGLLLGSFLNVCIHRLPRGKSIVRPGSACPGCGQPIAWYHNIPVISWLMLAGRCNGCAQRISVRYPLVELLAAAILVGAWLRFGASVEFAIVGAFSLAMVVLFFTDFDLQLLPDTVTLSGFVVGLTVAWWNPFLGDGDWRRVWMALSGAALGSGLLWGLGALYGRLRGVEAMGMGDVKMMAMVGAVAGPVGVLFTIFAASLVGAVVGVAMIPLRGRSLQDTLPYGCFLAPAAVAALLWSERVFDAYMRLAIPSS